MYLHLFIVSELAAIRVFQSNYISEHKKQGTITLFKNIYYQNFYKQEIFL